VSRKSQRDVELDLQRRRRSNLETARRADVELQGLRTSERVPEYEEGAQQDRETQTLARVGEAQRLEIERIDDALERLAEGRYGACRDCGDPIDPRRLEALPYAARCAPCAAQQENGPLTRSSAP